MPVTVALTTKERGAPEGKVLRAALFAWAFNPATRRGRSRSRSRPIPPERVKLLRAQIKRHGTTPDGRIFQIARGGIIQDWACSAVWADARAKALTPAGAQRSAPRITALIIG